MKERPILMQAEMVRATLRNVDPKTQTRRVVKPQPDRICSVLHLPRVLAKNKTMFDVQKSPYGQPGDRLWVRENGWERPERTPKMMREGADTWEPYYYDADGLHYSEVEDFKRWGFKRRPSIHMPRWASRITLEITAVRVERLQDISEADAIAEGCETAIDVSGGWEYHAMGTYRDGYRLLWDKINGPGSWDTNPWVWVIEFNRVIP